MATDILIVDDEADIREGVSGILSDEGHNTRTAKNSDEALAAIEARRPQLIFLDIWMQGSRLDGMQLLEIVKRGARVMQIGISEDGAVEIARRARGTPRIAGRLLRRVRDFAAVERVAVIDVKLADRALSALDVDSKGLDSLDHRYLKCIALNFGGGPVGIDTIAASLSESRDALEDIVEPYLLQMGFLNRTPRGRLLTPHAFRHMGFAVPQRPEITQGILPLDESDA